MNNIKIYKYFTLGKTEHVRLYPICEIIWSSWADLAFIQLSDVIPRGLKDINISLFSLLYQSKIYFLNFIF